jgi:hypothetical protein
MDRPTRLRQGCWWWRLVELEPRAHYGTPNSTRFTPTGSQQDRDFIQLTLKRRRVASSSSGGGSFSATLVGVEGLLRSTFSNGNWTQSLPELLIPLLPPSPPENQWIDLARRFCSKLGFVSCRSKYEENMPLFIGVLVPNRSARGVLTDFILGLIQNRVGWRESKWE